MTRVRGRLAATHSTSTAPPALACMLRLHLLGCELAASWQRSISAGTAGAAQPQPGSACRAHQQPHQLHQAQHPYAASCARKGTANNTNVKEGAALSCLHSQTQCNRTALLCCQSWCAALHPSGHTTQLSHRHTCTKTEMLCTSRCTASRAVPQHAGTPCKTMPRPAFSTQHSSSASSRSQRC